MMRIPMLLCILIGVTDAIRRHHHDHLIRGQEFEKRDITCNLPVHSDIDFISPNGWAMAFDRPCKPGTYCPYACKQPLISMQWDPAATSYTYPQSMNGGLLCKNDGTLDIPFPDRPLCAKGAGTFSCRNEHSESISICQTVLPGDEGMYIRSSIEAGTEGELAVTDINYWAQTSAHFYVNIPGVPPHVACTWGNSSNPIGNWTPFVTGANVDQNGVMFGKVGYNPKYMDDFQHSASLPGFGIRLECVGGPCNGLPCEIKPSRDGIGKVKSPQAAFGDSGAGFCVATAPKGSSLRLVVFHDGGNTMSTSVSASASISASVSSDKSSTKHSEIHIDSRVSENDHGVTYPSPPNVVPRNETKEKSPPPQNVLLPSPSPTPTQLEKSPISSPLPSAVSKPVLSNTRVHLQLPTNTVKANFSEFEQVDDYSSASSLAAVSYKLSSTSPTEESVYTMESPNPVNPALPLSEDPSPIVVVYGSAQGSFRDLGGVAPDNNTFRSEPTPRRGASSRTESSPRTFFFFTLLSLSFIF